MQFVYNKFRDFKSFELAYYDRNNELQRLFCTVKAIENNQIILNANNKTNRGLTAEAGAQLQIFIYTDTGVYSAKSKVLSVTPDESNTEYVISIPQNGKQSQRREHFRADLPVKFKMKVFQGDAHEKYSFIEGRCKNLCGKGMSYISDEPFLADSSVEIELFFEYKGVLILGELVYILPKIIDGKKKFVNAFIFININQEDIDFLSKKCFIHHMEQRKRNSNS